MRRVIDKLRLLYESDTQEAHRFRYGLLVFDIATTVFIVASSFLPHSLLVQGIDIVLGLIVLADFSARLTISPTPWKDLVHPTTLADVAAIVSFLAPIVGGVSGSCASCVRCGSFTPTSCSHACEPTACSSVGTRS
jgi:voltage-gated potassium channel